MYIRCIWIIKKLVIKNIITNNTNTQTPPNLSGKALMNPKKVKKNHSGIILSLVFIMLTISKLSSWKTKVQFINT